MKTETIQRPKKESIARKPIRIEKKESTTEHLDENRLRDRQKIETINDNDNIYDKSNNKKHIDDNEDYESEETNSCSEDSNMH